MEKLPLYQVDAFTNTLFAGNPAAVVPVDKFPSDEIMQQIAAENNLAETAFTAPRQGGSFDLRWFTPAVEIEFCGHATIASAHVLLAEMGHEAPVVFHTQIGVLPVSKTPKGYTLRGPHYAMTKLPLSPDITNAFGNDINAYYAVNNLYIEMGDAQAVLAFAPSMAAITAMLVHQREVLGNQAPMGVSIMAAGSGAFLKYDFISRHFAPLHGVNEGPVTGSAHSALGPFWAQRLQKPELRAYQCSKRGGELLLNVSDAAVDITGKAITYLRGEIVI